MQKTYQDGLADACKIMEFYLWFCAEKAAENDPAWQPYIDIRTLISKTNNKKADFVWDGKPLS